MTTLAAYSLVAAALFLASCTSERQPQRSDDVAHVATATSQGTATHAPTVPSAPATATAAADVVAPPSNAIPPPADRGDAGAPGGVLPLTPGVYVLAGSGCSAPANAGVRFYDGRGISGSATHACRTLVRSRRGEIHIVEQSCIDVPTGDGPRTSESQAITVHDALTFTLASADESARFRYCPMGELPEYLRQRMAELDGEDRGG